MKKRPQIRFAVAAPLANRAASQLAASFLGLLTQGGVLPDSHFALGYYLSPFSGLQFAAVPTDQVRRRRSEISKDELAERSIAKGI